MKNYEEVKRELSGCEVADYLIWGHIFIICLYNVDSPKQSLVISYGLDADKRSWCERYTTSLEPVLRYCMGTTYICKDKALGCSDRKGGDLDVEADWVGITSFEAAIEEICKASSLNKLDNNTCIKLFVSATEGDFSNFAGPLEYEFARNHILDSGIINTLNIFKREEVTENDQ